MSRMEKETLKKLISAAAGSIPADLVIRNGIVADVFITESLSKKIWRWLKGV